MGATALAAQYTTQRGFCQTPFTRVMSILGMFVFIEFLDKIGLRIASSSDSDGAADAIVFSDFDIAWKSDRINLYRKTTYQRDEIRVPPLWALYDSLARSENFTLSGLPVEDVKYPSILPDASKDEHLMVWMRTAMFPSFKKLYGKTALSQSKVRQKEYQINVKSCNCKQCWHTFIHVHVCILVCSCVLV